MRNKPRRLAQSVALALAVLAILAILLIPMYGSATSDSSGQFATTTVTVLAVNGPGILIVLAIPFVIALAPIVVQARATKPVSIAAAALLTAFSLISLLTIGGFFLPAAIAEIIAVFLPTTRSRGAT
jgi:hypothetical protein